MKLNLFDRFLQLFGVNITYEWCVVGCTIGRHVWDYRLEKCRNGTPVIAGGFLSVFKVENEEQAKELYNEFTQVADKRNKEKGY
jgi:hypothetical protein